MTKITLLDLLCGSLALALAGMLFGSQLAAWYRGCRLRRRAARARAGEFAAAKLLRRHGYRIVAEQLVQSCGLWVDGVWQPVSVRADYLASRRGRQYIVEVKTGRSAPNPANTTTRRQLLEYDRVFEADGLILADMERGKLHRIEFEGPPRSLRGKWHWAWVLATGLLLGLFVGRRFQPPLPGSSTVECETRSLSE